MIANPYKKTKKATHAGQKRVERPWETRSPSIATSAESIPQSRVQHHSNAPASSTPPASLNLQAPLPTSNASKETLEVDPFDCGIDWTAALQTLDAHSSEHKRNSPTATKISIAPSSHLQENSHRQHLNDVSHANAKSPEKPSDLHKLPPRKPVLNQSSKDADALSNLRPASWTHASASKPPAKLPLSRSNSITDSLDPDQRTLPPELRFKPKDVAPVMDEHQAQLVKHADIGAPLLNNWTLYSHQKHAILRALRMRRCILALDMGLGKTLIGCVWAKAFIKTMQLHVVVICPVSLQEEWKRSMEQATGLIVQDLAGASKKKSTEISSETTKSPSVSIHSWSKIPSDIEETYGDYVVIADEAHSMQSMQAARTKETLQLVSSMLCEGVLLLTGTPMKNGKPSNLFPLLKAVQHPLGRHQKAYEAHFCAGREVNFGRGRVWQATGASNLDQLRKLSKTHMLHLTKETCLKDLPPLERVFVKVPVSSRRVMQHKQALQELARIYNSRGNGAVQNDAILGAVQKLRMVGSLAKVEAAVEQAKGILQDEPAVVVFTSFQQVAKNVHHQLCEAGWKGELLTGETPAKKRQSMVDRFQQGISPVFCCTFGAGGVGLTLTAAHSVILVDRPWTPGDALQAEDRVRRIGQTKPVKCLWIRAFDIDEQIDEMIEQKKQTSAAVLKDGDGSAAERQSAPRLSIFQMLKSILPANQGLTQTSILQFSQEG